MVRRVQASLPQVDIFQILRLIRSKLPTTHLQYEWVKAHIDWTIPWARMTLTQQLNTMCDKLANWAVLRASSNEGNEKECSWLLPMEGAAIIVGSAKMTSNVATSNQFHLGREEARQFYTRPMKIKNGTNKGGLGWSAAAFNAVDWQAIAAAFKGKPDKFGLWLSKQAIGVRSTRKNLARIQDILDNRCPNCGSTHKDNKHLNRCTDPGWPSLFRKDVQQLTQWLYHNNQTDPELAFWIPYYPPRPNTYGRPRAQHVTSYEGSYLQPGHYRLDRTPPREGIQENCSASIKLRHSHKLQPHACTMGQTASGAPNSNIALTMAIPKISHCTTRPKVISNRRRRAKSDKRWLTSSPPLLQQYRTVVGLLEIDHQPNANSSHEYQQYWVRSMRAARRFVERENRQLAQQGSSARCLQSHHTH
jgi:hypothetical protein